MKNGSKHIVRFQGGFANQIFQYCLYCKLIEKYGQESVFADLSHYDICKDHGGYKLGSFFEIHEMNQIEKKITRITEENYSSVIFVNGAIYYYDGYWQSEVYFPADMSFLGNIFSEKNLVAWQSDILDEIRNTKAVSIHVRRGDYVDNYHHGNIATKAYYQNSISEVLGKYSDASFFVFSDDIEWCKTNLDFGMNNVKYCDGVPEKEWNDIFLMSECRINIISNSSFSWWGSFINSNEKKEVYSPQYWFNSFDEGLISDKFIKVTNLERHSKSYDAPLFSILVAAYNSSEYIRRCLSSLSNQTYENIEIIVVDDASNDTTVSIVEELSAIDQRIKLVKKTRNESLICSRISAMEESTGNYVLFIDADDYLNTDACEVLAAIIEEEHFDIIEFNYITEPKKERVVSTHALTEELVDDLLNLKTYHMVWNKCYGRDVVDRVLSVTERFYCNMGEDLYFTTVFFDNAKSYKKIEQYLHHYVDGVGMSTILVKPVPQQENNISSTCNLISALSNYFESRGINRDEEIKWYKEHMIKSMKEWAANGNVGYKNTIFLLNLLDRSFGTNLCEQYKKERGLFGMKILIKRIVNKLKRLVGNSGQSG